MTFAKTTPRSNWKANETLDFQTIANRWPRCRFMLVPVVLADVVTSLL